ncbi:bridging integrator 3-like [Xyrauchen texanus]|uniref:bridging integrator 3-like n=1 Tax=Xyrauchen texanus TaxID=154827 RepID=UPI0022429475|nr:bridging integrator 3-like [Xyrauchen texanus]
MKRMDAFNLEKVSQIQKTNEKSREELKPIREDFEGKNKQLLDEMPEFYNSRIDYFQPSFEALIQTQVAYFTEMHKIFTELMDQNEQGELTDEHRKQVNEMKRF